MPVPSSVLMEQKLLTRKQSLTIFTLSPAYFIWRSTFVLSHLLNYRHLSRLPIIPGQVACLLLSIAIISSLSGCERYWYTALPTVIRQGHSHADKQLNRFNVVRNATKKRRSHPLNQAMKTAYNLTQCDYFFIIMNRQTFL